MSRSHGRSRGIPLVVAGIVLGLAAGQARAADDGYDNVFSSVLGAVGVISVERSPEIEYRERPPLVLPPQMQLPKPVAPGTKRSAQWPQDPDVLKKRKASDEARAPVQVVGDHNGDALAKAELLKGRDGQRTAAGDTEPHNDCMFANEKQHGCLVVDPDVLKRQGEEFASANPDKQLELKPGVEAPRTYLTQPPKGYMTATRAVKATTEAPLAKDESANPMAFMHPQKKDDE